MFSAEFVYMTFLVMVTVPFIACIYLSLLTFNYFMNNFKV
jgi:hypothetical protein